MAATQLRCSSTVDNESSSSPSNPGNSYPSPSPSPSPRMTGNYKASLVPRSAHSALLLDLVEGPLNVGVIAYLSHAVRSAIRVPLQMEPCISHRGARVCCLELEAFIYDALDWSRSTPATILAVAVLLGRLRKVLPAEIHAKNYCTLHRVFIASLMLAHKSLNDVSPSTAQWAKGACVGIFGVRDLISMERELLSRLEFNISLRDECECEEYAHELQVAIEAEDARLARVKARRARAKDLKLDPVEPSLSATPSLVTPSPSPSSPSSHCAESLSTPPRRPERTFATLSLSLSLLNASTPSPLTLCPTLSSSSASAHTISIDTLASSSHPSASPPPLSSTSTSFSPCPSPLTPPTHSSSFLDMSDDEDDVVDPDLIYDADVESIAAEFYAEYCKDSQPLPQPPPQLSAGHEGAIERGTYGGVVELIYPYHHDAPLVVDDDIVQDNGISCRRRKRGGSEASVRPQLGLLDVVAGTRTGCEKQQQATLMRAGLPTRTRKRRRVNDV